MSSNCELILRWSATSGQLRALGAGLWRWCTRDSAGAGIYDYLDNQILADLLDGRLPASPRAPGQTDRKGPSFSLRDEASPNRQATIDRLRRELPTAGLADVVIDGVSWDRAGRQDNNNHPELCRD